MTPPPALGTAPAAQSKTGPQRPDARTQLEEGPDSGNIPVKARRPDSTSSGYNLSTGGKDEAITVSDFIRRMLPAGRLVRLRGTCIDQFHASGRAGPPPRSRSDWQLSDEHGEVYVSGAIPAECTAHSMVVSGVVAVDTVNVAGRTVPRRFLILRSDSRR